MYRGAKGEEFYRLKIAEQERDNRSWLARWFNLKPSLNRPDTGKPRPFDLAALNEGLDKVKEAYANQGYIMFHADKKMDVREEGGVKKVDVDVKVDEGEQYTVHRIAFEGNTKTKDKVLRRSMLLKEGDVFRTDAFRDSFTGISPAGLLRREEPGAPGGPGPGQAPGGRHHQGRGGGGQRGDVPGRLRFGVRLLRGRQLRHQEPGRRRADPQLQLHPGGSTSATSP